MTEPNENYQLLSNLPTRYFTAIVGGQRRRCRLAEHMNIGKGWLLDVEGMNRSVTDQQISGIEPAEPGQEWTLQEQARKKSTDFIYAAVSEGVAIGEEKVRTHLRLILSAIEDPRTAIEMIKEHLLKEPEKVMEPGEEQK